VRVNLEHVPEPLRPAQEALDPDAGPPSERLSGRPPRGSRRAPPEE
jgi:hypothetical protein